MNIIGKLVWREFLKAGKCGAGSLPALFPDSTRPASRAVKETAPHFKEFSNMKSSPFLNLLGAFVLPLVFCLCFIIAIGTKQHSVASASAIATPSPAQAIAQSSTATTSNGAQVTLNNLKFEPQNLTVTAGTTVTWTNKESTPHTVTADDKAFSSPNINPNGTFSHTFTKPGKYAYHCAYHGGHGTGMFGTVTVTAKGKKP